MQAAVSSQMYTCNHACRRKKKACILTLSFEGSRERVWSLAFFMQTCKATHRARLQRFGIHQEKLLILSNYISVKWLTLCYYFLDSHFQIPSFKIIYSWHQAICHQSASARLHQTLTGLLYLTLFRFWLCTNGVTEESGVLRGNSFRYLSIMWTVDITSPADIKLRMSQDLQRRSQIKKGNDLVLMNIDSSIIKKKATASIYSAFALIMN